MNVLITDFIKNTSIEKKILGNYLKKTKKNDVKILLVWHQLCDEKYLRQFPNLKLIIRYGVGYENISLNYIRKKKIKLANTPHYGLSEVSDTALSFLLSLTRKTYQYNFNLINKKKLPDDWQSQKINNIKRTSDYKVCSIGAGRIGSSFLIKAKSIGFQTFFYDPYVKSGQDKILGAKKIINFEEIFETMDIISLHCPLNEETKNLINKKILKKIKNNKEFFIINTARGGLINLDDLENCLLKKDIFFATDVLDVEPPVDKNHLFFKWQKNLNLQSRIIINPHCGFYSKNSYKEMRILASTNALNFIKYNKVSDQII